MSDPLAVIDLTGRRPLEFDAHYLWHPGPTELEWDYLPREIFDRLTGHIEKPPYVVMRVKAYTTLTGAMVALRRAVGGVTVLSADPLHGEQPREGEVPRDQDAETATCHTTDADKVTGND